MPISIKHKKTILDKLARNKSYSTEQWSQNNSNNISSQCFDMKHQNMPNPEINTLWLNICISFPCWWKKQVAQVVVSGQNRIMQGIWSKDTSSGGKIGEQRYLHLYRTKPCPKLTHSCYCDWCEDCKAVDLQNGDWWCRQLRTALIQIPQKHIFPASSRSN